MKNLESLSDQAALQLYAAMWEAAEEDARRYRAAWLSARRRARRNDAAALPARSHASAPYREGARSMIRNLVHFWRDVTYAVGLFWRHPRCPWDPTHGRVTDLEEHFRTVHAGDTIGRRVRR